LIQFENNLIEEQGERMAIEQPSTSVEVDTHIENIVNDFSITVATVNGSGSQTSNLTLMRALFKMGLPVSGKNLFPSNIQGLPTWYTIRINEGGFLARREEHEVIVAMNPATFGQDLKDLSPGGAFFYDDSIKISIDRDDIVSYPMPVKTITRDSGAPASLRAYIANMVYVGVLAQMLGIDMEKIHMALDFHFKGKEKPINLNWGVIQTAAGWTADNLEKQDRYVVKPLNKTEGLIMTDGNSAAAAGALYGGVQFCSWYPITPASSIAEALTDFLPILRKDPKTGRNTCAIVQAEDELAAIGMAIGAGWGGIRSMTSTSGPGLSLMTEFIGLAYFAEVPVVIWDIQRVGPSTGLPTRTSQGDLSFVNFIGHGDTQQVILLPGSINECFEYGWKSFDLAEKLQTPVFVLSDLDFGMNQWITAPLEYPDRPMDRGKVLWEEDLERMNGDWGRYLDVDGDGIPYRTLLGNRHPKAAYFTRGTGHTEYARYSEEPDVWEEMMSRLKKKYETAKSVVPGPVIKRHEDGSDIGIIAFGSTDAAIEEAIYLLNFGDIKLDYMRIRAVPFTNEVREFIENHHRNYVIELNRDGQLHQLLTLEISERAPSLISLAHLDGLPLTAQWVVDAVKEKEE
jgi:2-oxoglutarate ferredoxin oxidoreductase subunit alpha